MKSKDIEKLSSNQLPSPLSGETSSSVLSPWQAVRDGCREHPGPPRAGSTRQAPSDRHVMLWSNQGSLLPAQRPKPKKENKMPQLCLVSKGIRSCFSGKKSFSLYALGWPCSTFHLIPSVWDQGLVDDPGMHAYLLGGGEWKLVYSGLQPCELLYRDSRSWGFVWISQSKKDASVTRLSQGLAGGLAHGEWLGSDWVKHVVVHGKLGGKWQCPGEEESFCLP